MLLLDICALLWLAGAQKNFSKETLESIKSSAGNLYVSAISAFELAIKVQKGKLDLPLPPGEWYARAIDLYGLIEIPVYGIHASRAAELPKIHKDPCDRFIIAAALERGLTIVTADRIIPTYPGITVIISELLISGFAHLRTICRKQLI